MKHIFKKKNWPFLNNGDNIEILAKDGGLV